MSKVERIIRVLREHDGLDDDEISAATDIQPRQIVNQICRRLESQGLLTRTRSAAGAKIINFLKSSTALHRAEQAPKPVERIPTCGRDVPDFSTSGRGIRRSGSEEENPIHNLLLWLKSIWIICSGRVLNFGPDP